MTLTEEPGLVNGVHVQDNFEQSVGVVDVQDSEHHDVWPDQAELGVVDVDVAYMLSPFHRLHHVKVLELTAHLLLFVHRRTLLRELGLVVVRIALHEAHLIGRLRYV